MKKYVLTLAAPEELTEESLELACETIRDAGADVCEPRWLSVGSACDLPFDGAKPAAIEVATREALTGIPVDLAAQSATGRRKRLLVADMESTVIRNEMLDELADFAGERTGVENITARAMRGELDFADAVRARVALLVGLPAKVVEQALELVEIDPGARLLVATMTRHGASTALVSGGFDIFVEPVARRLGFAAWRANELIIGDGVLRGTVGEPILGLDAKVRALEELCQQLGLETEAALAVGDGANDLGMLRAAGLGVAYHAKPAVQEAARYSVRHGDLRTLLFFQGYREEDLAAG